MRASQTSVRSLRKLDCVARGRASINYASHLARAFAHPTPRPPSIPRKRLPRKIRQRLHVMDGVHPDVLIVLVELDAAGDAMEILRRRERIADRLGILAAAANDVRNQKNLVISVRIEVGRLLVVFGLERADEVLHQLALVRRIELHDADIAGRSLARLLLDAER